jgi:hypothetical protein
MAKQEPTIDDALAALGRGSFWFGRTGQGFSPNFVRELLARDSKLARHVLLKLAIPSELPDDELMARWQRAIAALRDLDLTYAWGSKQRRSRFRALATDPAILAAIQGAAAMGEDVPIDMLAVLVADGSDASIDALIPHLGPALDDRDTRLDYLRRLRTHAADTPRVRALLGELDDTYEARNAVSQALALGPVIGIGPMKELWFDISFGSREHDSFNASIVQLHISIDSRSARWFDVYMSVYGVTQFTRFGSNAPPVDRHGVGSCEPADLPAWLAATAKHLRVTWGDRYITSNLRGAKRSRILSWLDGEPGP